MADTTCENACKIKMKIVINKMTMIMVMGLSPKMDWVKRKVNTVRGR